MVLELREEKQNYWSETQKVQHIAENLATADRLDFLRHFVAVSFYDDIEVMPWRYKSQMVNLIDGNYY